MVTPETIDEHIETLIKRVGSKSSPIYLDVEPESYAKVGECFPAVGEKIRRDGGTQVLGWQLWSLKHIVEAEFHAVWRSPGGNLTDITPKLIPVCRILFLPDPGAKYAGAQVDNVRLNISGSRLVDDLIAISQARFRLLNKGERSLQHQVRLRGHEADQYKQLAQLEFALLSMVGQGATRNSKCFCGSDAKYKRCHGKNLRKVLSAK